MGIDDKKLVLEAAGFAWSQLTKALINDGFEVIGIDFFDETSIHLRGGGVSLCTPRGGPGVFRNRREPS
jgi:nucleoside-diphosphate-sugar epimerase